jgi:hypothetical protein
VYLYFLVSIPKGLCQIPLIIILFPFDYIVGLFHYYDHITFIISLSTSLGTPYYPPWVYYKEAWFKIKLEVCNFKVFGCEAWANLPKEKHKSMQPKVSNITLLAIMEMLKLVAYLYLSLQMLYFNGMFDL